MNNINAIILILEESYSRLCNSSTIESSVPTSSNVSDTTGAVVLIVFVALAATVAIVAGIALMKKK